MSRRSIRVATCSTTPPSRCRRPTFRGDITVIGVPLTAICQRGYSRSARSGSSSRTSSMWALCRRMLDMDSTVIETLIGEQYQGQGKTDRSRTCMRCIWAATRRCENLPVPAGHSAAASADTVGDQIFIEGNDAAALGAVYGGATVARGIRSRRRHRSPTRSRTIAGELRVDPETKQAKYAIIQAEDETVVDRHGDRRRLERRARVHRNLGSRRVADEGISGSCLLRGDSGGTVRRAARRAVDRHADPHPAMRPDPCAYASHGDTKHVMLFPEDPAEAFEFGALAFDLADRLQTPIFVMLDLEIGMND